MTTTPAIRAERLIQAAVADLKPHPRNARRHPARQLRHLQKNIERFGFVVPIVIDRQDRIVCGHARVEAARRLGMARVPAIRLADLSEAQLHAFMIADNRLAELARWDEPLLAESLKFLKEQELDLELVGFELEEADDLILEVLGEGEAEPAEGFDLGAALEAGGEPVTKPGEVIELGPHRLLCGDATDPEQVRTLMNGERAVLFATDPPYLVGYDGTNHPGAKRKGRTKKPQKRTAEPSGANAVRTAEGRKDWSGTYGVSWDDADAQPELYQRFIAAAVAEALDGRAAWYCWYASRHHAMLEEAWRAHGAFVHCQIIWVKNKGVPTRTWYLWQHEPCLMGWRQGQMPERVQQKRFSTVWEFDTIPNGADRPDHPTPKPLEVFEIPMRQHTRQGGLCYEPFAGSGTQLIAAERLQRRCFAMEISPVYCDLIVRRYLAFAGENAVDPALAERYRLPEPEEETSDAA